nr:rust resistance kinase Lr10-like [Ipomoea batatas]
MTTSYLINYLLLVIFATTVCYGHEHEDCEPKRCDQKGGPDVLFPFRLIGKQPDECGYNGFELSCTKTGETAMKLPFPVNSSINNNLPIALSPSVNLIIKKIDYESETMEISKVDGCHPVLLSILEPLSSPFRLQQGSVEISFFSCSSSRTGSRSHRLMMPVSCLNKPGHHVYAVASHDQIADILPLLVSCTKMFSALSVDSWLQPGGSIEVNWKAPSCKECGAVGGDGYCWLENTTNSQQLECSAEKGLHDISVE